MGTNVIGGDIQATSPKFTVLGCCEAAPHWVPAGFFGKARGRVRRLAAIIPACIPPSVLYQNTLQETGREFSNLYLNFSFR